MNVKLYFLNELIVQMCNLCCICSFDITAFLYNCYIVCCMCVCYRKSRESCVHFAVRTLDDFTFWIILSLRPSLSPKYGLRPKISEK